MSQRGAQQRCPGAQISLPLQPTTRSVLVAFLAFEYNYFNAQICSAVILTAPYRSPDSGRLSRLSDLSVSPRGFCVTPRASEEACLWSSPLCSNHFQRHRPGHPGLLCQKATGQAASTTGMYASQFRRLGV